MLSILGTIALKKGIKIIIKRVITGKASIGEIKFLTEIWDPDHDGLELSELIDGITDIFDIF